MSSADVAYSAGSRQLNTTRLMQAIALAFLAVKVTFIFTAGPASDEVYYWMWGQIPELSYFDHPPLHAWLLGLSHTLFGRSLFALRWLTLVSMAGTFWIFMVWAQRLSGRYWQSQFWVGVVIYLASPTFGFFGSVAFHDHLLIFLCLLSGHFFINYLTAWETRGKLAPRQPLSRGDRPRACGAHQVQRDLPRARRRRGHLLQPQLPAVCCGTRTSTSRRLLALAMQAPVLHLELSATALPRSASTSPTGTAAAAG